MRKSRWEIIPAACVFIILLFFAYPINRDHTVSVIAHRGGAASAPENTLAALRNAIETGADMAEMDLRMTRDGVVVALHDETLLRTTGLDQPVREIDSGAIQNLDVGITYSPTYAGEHIPTLIDLLKTAKNKIPLMLEIKADEAEPSLLKKTISQIRDMNMKDGCLIGSMDISILHRSKNMAPEIKTVCIVKETTSTLWSDPALDSISVRFSDLTPEDIQLARQTGKKLYVWTVNTQIEIETAINMGVDGIVTDHVALGVTIASK